MPPSRADIFDLFYGQRLLTRAGGGTAKARMTRLSPSFEAMEALRGRLGDDPALLAYFAKLRDRDPGIAPPPKPST